VCVCVCVCVACVCVPCFFFALDVIGSNNKKVQHQVTARWLNSILEEITRADVRAVDNYSMYYALKSWKKLDELCF